MRQKKPKKPHFSLDKRLIIMYNIDRVREKKAAEMEKRGERKDEKSSRGNQSELLRR
jgi:hypothetical protein